MLDPKAAAKTYRRPGLTLFLARDCWKRFIASDVENHDDGALINESLDWAMLYGKGLVAKNEALPHLEEIRKEGAKKNARPALKAAAFVCSIPASRPAAADYLALAIGNDEKSAARAQELELALTQARLPVRRSALLSQK